MADQGDEWASPESSAASGAQPGAPEQPRFGERTAGWTPPTTPAEPTAVRGPAAPPAYAPPPKPGLIPLHPLGFGQLLGSSFGVIRWNPRATVVPALLINVVETALSLGLLAGIGLSAVDRIARATDADRGAIIAGTVAEGVAGGLLLLAVSVFGGAILQGMLVSVVARGALGERPTAREALRSATRSIWPLVGVAALLGALQAIAVVVLVVLVVGVATAGVVGVILAVLIALVGGLAFAAAYAFLAVKLATVPSAIVLERLGVRGSIARSWVLLRGSFWRTFGLLALILAMVYAATQLVSLPFSVLGGAAGGLLFPNGATTDPTTTLGPALITSLPAAIVGAIIGGIGQIARVSAVVLVYLDRRMRREGLDLELRRYVEQGGRDPFEPLG